jgi:hypothetical protein
MIKLFYRAGYLPVHIFDPFIIHSTTCGTLRPIYRGVYIVGGPGEARDIFIHMDGSVAFGLSHHTLSCYCALFVFFVCFLADYIHLVMKKPSVMLRSSN